MPLANFSWVSWTMRRQYRLGLHTKCASAGSRRRTARRGLRGGRNRSGRSGQSAAGAPLLSHQPVANLFQAALYLPLDHV